MPEGTSIRFASHAGEASGHLVRPGRDRPGVVVIQEWWGLVPHIKDVAERFAAQGYVTLAPDLYHGKSTVEAEEASHLMHGLDWVRATQEIAGAVRHLKEAEGATRVGIVGFCMGGALAIIAAAQAGVDAYASFYGFPPKAAPDVLERIKAPGIFFFGEHEDTFSVPDARAFVQAQNGRGRAAELVEYPKAGHAFFNNDRPTAYQREAAHDAWCRTLDLFGRTLRG